MIPKIIHQIWIQGVDEVPEYFKPWMDKWKELHPNWEHKFWDKDSINKLLSEHYPEYVEYFNEKLSLIKKCDFSRYILLLHFGGMYCDIDMYPLSSIDELIKKIKLDEYDTTFIYEVSMIGVNNSWILSKSNSSALQSCFDETLKKDYLSTFNQFGLIHMQQWTAKNENNKDYKYHILHWYYSHNEELKKGRKIEVPNDPNPKVYIRHDHRYHSEHRKNWNKYI